jgi:hypothetical protein
MIIETLYESFLYLVVILKFVYFASSFLNRESTIFKMDKNTIAFLAVFKNTMYEVENLLIQFLLLIVFNPFIDKKITVNREEQILLFVYGVIGLLHYIQR